MSRRLNVLVLTADESFADDLERVCEDRGHALTRIERLRNLRGDLATTRPNVLLLDWRGSPSDAAATAAAIRAVHPGVDVVIAAEAPPSRCEGGFRVVDRFRAGERLVDELELAWLGLPASVPDAGDSVQPNG